MNATNSLFLGKVTGHDNFTKVKIITSQGIQFVALNSIASIVAAAPYAYVHFTDGMKVFCSQSIKHFDDQLSDFGFVRVHKSYLINVTAISLFVPECNGCAKLVNGQQIGFARGKKRMFIEVVEAFCL